MVLIFAPLITSLLITFFAIPSIIKIAEIKNLFDVPDERRTHKTKVPKLGGLAIFAGMVFSLTFWPTQKDIGELRYILSSIIILFFIGMKDDLFNLVAYKKLIGQLLAAFILVHWSGTRITNFFGIFGVTELNSINSYLFSIFTIVVITNSLNLIDGIDCLAGVVGIVAATIFGGWFFMANQTQYVILSASLVGSLLGFLYYNRTPARIFMGDAGSLLVGITLSILAIKFIELDTTPFSGENKIRCIPVIAIGVLIIPLFDTLRVFTIRMLRGKSPFNPDRNHLHHLLIDLGFSHIKATTILTSFNLGVVLIIIKMQHVRNEIVLSLVLVLCIVSSFFLAFQKTKKNHHSFLASK